MRVTQLSIWKRLRHGAAAIIGAIALTGIAATSLAQDAPGAPGDRGIWAPANKTGYGTSKSTTSKVWYTLQNGKLTEVYYPDLGTPSVRDLQFIVTNGSSFAERDGDATTQQTELVDQRALIYRQTNTSTGRYRITKTYITDPARHTVMIDVDFESLNGQALQLYVLYDPRLGNDGNHEDDRDIGRRDGDALIATDRGSNASAAISSALAASPAFTATSSGYMNRSDGWTDLRTDFRMDWQYSAPSNGNVVQTGRLPLTGLASSRRATIALGFGGSDADALSAARGSLAASYSAVSTVYANEWHAYVASLKAPPAILQNDRQRLVYNSAVMILAAHEDKTYPGAFVASPTMPWAWGATELEKPSGPYHLVWARDIAGKAAGLAIAGDTAAGDRVLNYLFKRQQKSDGSFPQNSTIDGRERWTNTQMDEVAAPIILAWSLNKKDADTWSHVKRAADYIINNGPVTRQERWENQPGYSPATIAAEIAGLVCAADIAMANGDTQSAASYLAKADDWRANVKRWTLTTNGPYNPKPYFLRITRNGDPDNATTQEIGDSGPDVDQRAVVDPSFLELVRLGIFPADDPDIVRSLQVVDAQLAENTPTGQHWHRYSFCGYGERDNGDFWNFGFQKGSQITKGRLWTLLTGERGEYEIARGQDARARLEAMAQAGQDSGILTEQVWDSRPPGGQPGFPVGKPSFSASPLGWTHGQYVRLAWSIQENRVLSWPCVVTQRYLGIPCGPPVRPPTAPGQPAASNITLDSVTLTWSPSTAGDHPIAGYDVLQNGVVAASTNVSTRSVEITGLQSSTTYSFTVRAKDTQGNFSLASPATSVTTRDDPSYVVPGAPGTPVASSTTSNGTTLTWSAATAGTNPIGGYEVYNGAALAASTDAATLTAAITGLSPSTTYSFTVKAKDTQNRVGAASPPVSVTTTALPSPTRVWVGGTFSNWSLAEMAGSNGVFEITRALATGNHELKFANTANWSGRDWGNATGLSGTAREATGGLPNITFSIDTPGSYVIRFNGSTLQYSITAAPASIWVGGTFSSWSLGAMSYVAATDNYESVRTLSAGNHQLKFANTGNWSGTDWGNANGLSGTASVTTGGLPNISFSVVSAGSYLIRFNLSTLAYSITAVPGQVWVGGTFSSWSLGAMTYVSGSSTYAAVRTLSAGNHELKFANTSNWSGTDWGNASGLSGTATVTTGGLPNIGFTLTQSGSYTINFNPQTLAYSIAPVQ